MLLSVRVPRPHSLRQKFDHDDSSYKPTHVRPKRDSAATCAAGVRNRRCCTTQELKNKPVTQNDPGRKPNKREEDNQRHESQNARGRVEEEISAHHTGYRSAGADAWNS